MASFLLVPLTLVIYLLGVRFIGRPLAQWSWRFWTEKPYRSCTIWSYLLYPLAHVTTPPGFVLQEYKLPYKRLSNQPLPGHSPLICQEYLYGESCGTSEGHVPGYGTVWVRYLMDDLEYFYDDAEPRYIRHASWAWPLRLAILPLCHVMVLFELPMFFYRRICACISYAT